MDVDYAGSVVDTHAVDLGEALYRRCEETQAVDMVLLGRMCGLRSGLGAYQSQEIESSLDRSGLSFPPAPLSLDDVISDDYLHSPRPRRTLLP
ncbi:MAG: hypothetical protein ABIH41_05550 [Nanoarchaeota archaeon]